MFYLKSFIIDIDEYKVFQNEDRRLSRTVEERTFREDDLEYDSSSKNLLKTVKEEFIRFRKAPAKDIKGLFDIECLSIQIEKDDGMTWCAESINEMFEKAFSQYSKKKRCIKGYQHDGLPHISQLLTENKLRKVLKKELLNKSKDYTKLLRATIIAILMIIVNILTGNVNNPNVNFESIINTFSNKTFWVLFAVILIFTIIAQELYSLYISKDDEKSDEEIRVALEKESRLNSEKFDNLIQILSKKIHPNGFRITIVDGYSNLDLLSRRIIESYLISYDSEGRGSEFWIILDTKKSGANNFNRFVLGNIESWIFKTRTHSYYLNYITSIQKRKIIELLRLPDEYESYRLIKTICKGELVNSNWNIEQLVSYRSNNPKNDQIYDEFDLFFLLSLLSSPANMYFTKDYYIKILSSQGKVRSEIISEFLKGTKLFPSEFKDKLNILFPSNNINKPNHLLSNFTESITTGKTTRYAIIPEIKYSLINNFKKLNLPDPKIGNLFWGLYWGDNIKTLKEAAWLRKLCHHLKNRGEIFRFSEEQIEKIYNRLFDIYLDAIEGCLSTGLYSEVSNLLDDLLDLSIEHKFNDDFRVSSLIRRCWQSFILLKYSRIMEILIDIVTQHKNIVILEDKNKASLNESIFWELIPSNYVRKSKYNLLTLTKNVKHSKLGSEELKSLTLYSNVFSDRTILMFAPFSMGFEDLIPTYMNTLLYLQPYKNEYKNSIETLKALVLRLENMKIPYMVDLLTVSNLIWNIALIFNCNAKEYKKKQIKFHRVNYNESSEGISDEDLNEIIEYRNFPHSELENFKELLNISYELAVVLKKLMGKVENKKEHQEDNAYLDQTLAVDVFSNVIINLVISYDACNKYSTETLKLNTDEIEMVNSIIGFSNSILSYQLPIINEASDLIYDASFLLKINSLLRLCTITWRSLDLENLAHNLELKGIHFNFMIEHYKETEKIVKASSELIKQQSIYGVYANLLVALSENDSKELRSEYFYSAFEIILKNNFGEQIVKEMMYLLITEYNRIDLGKEKLQACFRNFVSNGHFKILLTSIKINRLKMFCMGYFVFERGIESQEVKDYVEKEIIEYINQTPDSDYKEGISSFMLSRKMNKTIREKSNIVVEELISEWTYSKVSESYAWVLNALVEKGYYKDVKEDSLHLLNKNFNNYKFSSILHLANNMSKQLSQDENEEKKMISDYLDKAMLNWSEILTTDENIRFYTSLNILKPEKGEFYLSEIKKWVNYQSALNDIKIKYFLKYRRYYDLYRFCYKILRNFGLQSDLEETLLEKEFYSSLKEIKIKLGQWRKKENGIIPHPFIFVDNEELISSKFLIIGHFLFESDLYKESSLTSFRKGFNQIAEKNIYRLFDLIKNLPDVPKKFQEIIIKYSNQFGDDFITPEQMTKFH